MLKLLGQLRRTGWLTSRGLYRLVESVVVTGTNPMALLRATAKLHGDRIAVVDDTDQVTYCELWQQAETTAKALSTTYGLHRGQRIAIACHDHIAAVKAVFAAARLGAHVYLLNPGMRHDQLRDLHGRQKFDFYVFDEPLAEVFTETNLSQISIPAYHPTGASIDGLSKSVPLAHVRLKKSRGGNIVVLTGGTTGQPKAASRKPSVFAFLPPFCALLTQVELGKYRSVYVATPLFHGFGLASLFISVVLGVTIYVSRRFDARRACSLVAEHDVDVVTLVPLMLHRMLQTDSDAVSCLRCVISGGAVLSPALASSALERIGPKLFNMFGTSEAGFCIMASPQVLAHKPESIGKPVAGVRARISDKDGRELGDGVKGHLCIRSAWTTNRKSWIETGDLAYRDAGGDLFLCGRVDDMVVSGGENVYPIELENVLVQHASVESVAVIGIPDPEFGQRLKAVVKLNDPAVDAVTLLEWLKSRVARHQMPAVIEVREELPYTPLGKVDKKALRRRAGNG